MSARFTVDRARHGSIGLRDELRGNRLVATFYRDIERLGKDKADVVTQQMAEICAEALSRKHEELTKNKEPHHGSTSS